jgi:hypothetical protein
MPGQAFSTQLDGQIYAQPLSVGGTLIVTTETDHVYGLDPEALRGAHISKGATCAPLSCFRRRRPMLASRMYAICTMAAPTPRYCASSS